MRIPRLIIHEYLSDSMEVMSFTAEVSGIARVLLSPCTIWPAHNPSKTQPKGKEYRAIWDTGATNSVITRNVVNDLGLSNFTFTTVNHGGGTTEHVPVYKVNIGLPNHVAFENIRVSEGKIAGADVIIGMDIITRGDFAITNVGGKTTFTFRVPPVETINFVKTSARPSQSITQEKVTAGDDPCPCGSGKKFKDCHGKGVA